MTDSPHSRRFDRVEILHRLRAVETGEMTLYERELVEQLEVEREAFRLACRDLQDAHAGFTDIRRHDYEPPDDGDVEALMTWLRGRASSPAKRPT